MVTENSNIKLKSPKIFFKKRKSTIKRSLFLERVIDWHEDGEHIQKLLHDFDNQYRKKICSKCTKEQQQVRNCIRIDMYTNEGIQITSCNHMDQARTRKNSKIIKKFIQSSPVLNLT